MIIYEISPSAQSAEGLFGQTELSLHDNDIYLQNQNNRNDADFDWICMVISTKTAYYICAKVRFWDSYAHIYRILTMTWYNIGKF